MDLQEQVRILEQAEEKTSMEKWPFLQYIVICGLNRSAREVFSNDPESIGALSDLLPLAEACYIVSLMGFAQRLGVAIVYAEEAVKTYALSYAHRIRGEILQEYPYLEREAAVTRTDLEGISLEDIGIEGRARITPEKVGLLVGLIDAYIAAREQRH